MVPDFAHSKKFMCINSDICRFVRAFISLLHRMPMQS